MEVGIDEDEKDRKRKYMAIFSTGGGDVTCPENMEGLYASVWSLGMEEEVDLTFPYWKVFDE